MKFYTRFSEFVLQPYRELDYLSRARAKYLMIMSVIMSIIVVLGSSMLLAFLPENFFKALRNLAVFIVAAPISVFFLRYGKYSIASIIFLSSANLGVTLGMITRVFENPLESLTTYYFFGFAGISLCMLFSGIRMLSFVAFLYAFALIFNFSYGISKIPEDLKRLYTLNFYDGLVGLIAVYSVGVLMVRIFRKNYRIIRAKSQEFENQNHFIKKVLKENADQVIELSHNLKSSVSEISQEASRQAASAEEVSANVKELEEEMHNIFLRAREQEEQMEISKKKTKELSENMKAVKEKTKHVLDEIGTMMQRYESAEKNILAMQDSIKSIESSSQEMKSILKIITDIAGKVNMLSLNAAIEAARAGEAGRGFTVVAEEISNLADKTSSSIKGIDQLIQRNKEEIRKGMERVNEATGDYKKIAEGIRSVKQLLVYLSELTENQSRSNLELEQDSKIVLHLSREISEATQETKNQTESISCSMDTISQISYQFMEAMRKVEEYSLNLLDMARELNRKIETESSKLEESEESTYLTPS